MAVVFELSWGFWPHKKSGLNMAQFSNSEKKGWTLHLSMLGYFWGLDVTKIGGERVVGPRLWGICIQILSVCQCVRDRVVLPGFRGIFTCMRGWHKGFLILLAWVWVEYPQIRSNKPEVWNDSVLHWILNNFYTFLYIFHGFQIHHSIVVFSDSPNFQSRDKPSSQRNFWRLLQWLRPAWTDWRNWRS